jgi:methionyl-tRNA formyltransferase
MKTKIAFFGTQEFAATILAGLLTDNNISIATVFTQPDRKVGRKQILEESPVKKLALKHNLNIINQSHSKTMN